MITITYKDSDKMNGDTSAFISFPYDNNIVAIMRTFPSRFWHPQTKQWEIPAKKVPKFLEQLDELPYQTACEIIGTYNDEPREVAVPEGFSFKTKPFDHQIDGFNYGLTHDKFLLGDQQGLGKTKQLIDIAVAKKLQYGYKHCFIICCVNGLKWNWRSEIQKHSNEDCWILGQRINRKHKTVIQGLPKRLEDLENIDKLPYFVITNVETLRTPAICAKLEQLCNSGKIEMVAIDEIHLCKNTASQQGSAILKIQPQTRIAMTGTPLMNNPIDLYIIMKWLGYEKHSLWQFKNHYCVLGGFGGREVVGYKNLSELRENFTDICLRRLKEDVLDLPEKIYTTEFVEMRNKQKIIYDEVMQDVRENIDKIKSSNNPLAELIRLRQATGYTGILSSTIQKSAKLDRMEQLVEEIVENGGKCIIFSNWTSVTTPATERLRRFNPAVITGQTKDGEAERNKFMTDDSCKCVIGTIDAMGTGYTLTAATTVIFLDSPWNMARKEQATDRAHRIGTTTNITVVTIVCKDTIDERIEELVAQKGAMSDMLVDGKITANSRGDVIDFLLS